MSFELVEKYWTELITNAQETKKEELFDNSTITDYVSHVTADKNLILIMHMQKYNNWTRYAHITFIPRNYKRPSYIIIMTNKTVDGYAFRKYDDDIMEFHDFHAHFTSQSALNDPTHELMFEKPKQHEIECVDMPATEWYRQLNKPYLAALRELPQPIYEEVIEYLKIDEPDLKTYTSLYHDN